MHFLSKELVEIWVSGCEAGLQPVWEPYTIPQPSVKVATYALHTSLGALTWQQEQTELRRGPDFTGVAITPMPQALMNNKICDN